MRKRFFLFLVESLIFLGVISCSFSQKDNKSILGFQNQFFSDNTEKNEIQKLSSKDYLNWYNETREILSIKIDTLGYNFKLDYRPSEMEAIKLSDSDQDLDSLFALKSNYYYFLLTTSATQANSMETLSNFAKGNEMNFYMQKAFRLVSDGDSVLCSQFVPIRETLSVDGSISFFLAFEKKQFKSSDLFKAKLLYHDLYLTGNLYTMKFNDPIYQQLPHLIINKKL